MATENTGILTDAGQKLIDRVNNSQTKITYTKVVFSSDDNSKLNDDQVRALTAIKSQDVVTNSPSVLFDDNNGATIVRTLDDNTKLTSGLYIRTYGLFAKDDSGNEILYAVTVTSNPDYLPSYDGMSAQEIAYSFQSVIKNTANVNFTDVKDVYLMKSDMGDYAEKGDLDKYETKTDMSNYQKLLSYTPADDLKVVHTTGDETIDGQKKFDTDPTDGAGNAYAKTIDVNQQLDKKVVDNKNGTEQLNGVKVQPFNMLSDTIGGRNLLLGTSNQVVQTNNWNMKVADIKYDKSLGGTLCASVMINNADHASWLLQGSAQLNLQTLDKSGNILARASGNYVAYNANGLSWCSISIDDNTSDVQAYIWTNNMTQNAFYSCLKIEKGSIATDWTPAPEDKVNVSDMRKPASDVAGIEEVNAKQDKIGYTPADDSKVVHSTDMRKPASDVVGLEDITTACNQGGIANRTDVHSITKEGLYQLNGSSLINFIDSGQWWGTIQVINQGGAILQIARVAQGDIYTNSYAGSPAHWTGWTKLADDSKVAHLSGANNFDTVPTVNNNPLLLASSLPSDLARLSQNANFTAKLQQNGQDVALANNTIYRNPNTGSVSTANTFTQPQTFSIAPTITDASQDKGDNQAATMADLKSVENSAWRQLNKGEKLGGTLLYKIDQSSKRIYLLYAEHISEFIENGTIIADFSSIVKNIKTISGKIYCEYESDSSVSVSGADYDLAFESPALIATSGRFYGAGAGAGAGNLGFSNGTYFTYDSLR